MNEMMKNFLKDKEILTYLQNKWVCKVISAEQISKKTRRIKTSGLFFYQKNKSIQNLYIKFIIFNS